MFGLGTSPIEQRIRRLQSHLEQENPILLDAVRSFRTLDRVAYRLGLLEPDTSFTANVPWWPMVAVLGTFSSGKSSFINQYLGAKIQATGNQAVDDRFTVICYTNDNRSRVLPGVALDADPRFPFYKMSRSIEQVQSGEGKRVDSYLQLKTCPAERLRGKIFIDSPGFDADAQRTATLRITEHIITLSDLVLVFFDARHPEPGAMHDTLRHLVTETISRPDSNKFMFVLNQIDNAAREDNPEEVFAAWQRALAQAGLTAGRFYRIYNPELAIPIPDPRRRERFERKREEDVGEIETRIAQVEVDRAYRILSVLEQTAKSIRDQVVPRLTEAKRRWKRRVLWLDTAVFGSILGVLLALSIYLGYWQGLHFGPPWLKPLANSPWLLGLLGAGVVAIAAYLHYSLRRIAAQTLLGWLGRTDCQVELRQAVPRAFLANTRPWHSIFFETPVGWSARSARRLEEVIADANRYIQSLNNRFADPSGTTRAAGDAGPAGASPAAPVKTPAATTPPPAPARPTPIAQAVVPPRDYASEEGTGAEEGIKKVN